MAAVIGGVLLAIRPDGSLISADPKVLQGTPFTDWRLPGVLLATLIGLGLLGTGIGQLVHLRYRRQLSALGGFGLVCFESAELAWLGFQPLELVAALVGASIVYFAWRQPAMATWGRSNQTAQRVPAAVRALPHLRYTRSNGVGLDDDRIRWLGVWSARTLVALETAYIAVFVAGFTSIGNTSAPLPDPYLAVAEVLILGTAPVLVVLMLAIHHTAPQQAKPFTLVALGWMMAAAAFTTVVHFVELTVARHFGPETFPGYDRIFGFKWPSTFYAIDIVAWDIFFAFALLFALPAFAHQPDAKHVRWGLLGSGSLSMIGLVGPLADVLAWRTIGIIGYTVVFGLTCIPLSQYFQKAGMPRDNSPTQRLRIQQTPEN